MTLDQELVVATDVPAVFLDPGQRRAELRADILAAAQVGGDVALSGRRIDAYAFQTRPTILRRLAALLAIRIPADVDRLVTAEPTGVVLTAAVALHTGLPFALVRDTGSGTELSGEIHRGERVVVLEPVITTGAGAVRVAELVGDRGAEVTGVLAAIGPGQGTTAVTDTGHTLHVLFPTDDPADDPADGRKV